MWGQNYGGNRKTQYPGGIALFIVIHCSCPCSTAHQHALERSLPYLTRLALPCICPFYFTLFTPCIILVFVRLFVCSFVRLPHVSFFFALVARVPHVEVLWIALRWTEKSWRNHSAVCVPEVRTPPNRRWVYSPAAGVLNPRAARLCCTWVRGGNLT